MYKSLTTGHLGIKNLGFEQTLALAKKYGYGAVGYSPVSLEEEGIGTYEALDLMGRYGIIISDFGLPVDVTGKAALNSTFPKLEKAARMAAELGIHRCCTWLKSWSDELEYAENFAHFIWALRITAKVLKEYGIRLGVEFLGPISLTKMGKYPFIHTIDQALELCDAVGTGNIGLLLDAHHCYASGLKGGEFAKHVRSEKDLVLVHLNDSPGDLPLEDVKDSPRFYPGEPGGGGNDVAAFMKSLTELKYTGPVVMEPFSETINAMNDPDAVVRLVSESTASVWPA